MASIFTDKGRVVAWNGDVALDSGPFKGVLLKNTYTPSKDHDFVNDLSAHECDATNYAGGFGGAGRKALANPVVVIVAGNVVKWDVDDPSAWGNLGGAANNTLRYMAVVVEITNDAASPVIAVLDFGANYVTNGTDFTVTINSSGVATSA